jgi:hypothetical protein
MINSLFLQLIKKNMFTFNGMSSALKKKEFAMASWKQIIDQEDDRLVVQ